MRTSPGWSAYRLVIRGGHIIFGCRVVPVEGNQEPAATAVTAAIPYRDSLTFGRKLSRNEALTHPRLPEFWRVVDYLLLDEPAINHHVYAHDRARQREVVVAALDATDCLHRRRRGHQTDRCSPNAPSSTGHGRATGSCTA